MFARSARLVRAVAGCDPGRIWAGRGWCSGEKPLGFVVRVACHCGVCARVLEPRGHSRVGLWWHVVCGTGLVACYEVQYRPQCGGCVGVTGSACARHLWGDVGNGRYVLGCHVVFWYAPLSAVANDGGLRGIGLVWGP